MKVFLIILLAVVLFGGGFWLGSGVAGRCVRDMEACSDCLSSDSPAVEALGFERCLRLQSARNELASITGDVFDEVKGFLGSPE